jgi:lactoylglutathione lyase
MTDSDDRNAPVAELRLALTVDDFNAALRFYRDDLGLQVRKSWEQPTGSGAILEAGIATLELLSVEQAELIDQVEVGHRAAGQIRVALEVEDSDALAQRLEAAGAEKLGQPVVTPWSHRNVRLNAPDGLQLTLFTILPGGE